MDDSKKRQWFFVTFGTSVNTAYNSFSGSIEAGDLVLWSLNGKGKLVPASTDGIAFYYTVLNAKQENFTLSAELEVEQWTFSNGQDGFGLMAADAIGINGDETSFWNNSYMASVTRVEYEWNDYRSDPATAHWSDVQGHYLMRLGVGAQEKRGVTPLSNQEGTQIQHFRSTMETLENYAPKHGKKPGAYNLVGGYTNEADKMNDVAAFTKFRLSIRRMNDGYLLRYTDEEGVTNSRKYYHGDEGDALVKLDKEHIYVGFFAARNAKIRVKNVRLEIIPPDRDEQGAPRPVAEVAPKYGIQSANVANRETYDLVTYGNADGKLKVAREGTGAVLAVEEMRAGVKNHIPIQLQAGDNDFLLSFVPDRNYRPSKYEKLASYETRKMSFRVSYRVRQEKTVYVSPEGTESGAGTIEEPLDIYTAVSGAVPGQKLILAGGRYLLPKPLVIARGMDGTKQEPICLTVLEGCRPVLDFGRKSEGLTIGGNYWHLYGFDVTNTAPFARGIHLAGSHNRLERISVYCNGNTGLQIGCYHVTDDREEWPCDNQVINCTSYLNADPGYTDSDGFAAKITVGGGNVFDGCISAYNADDGFDLFAKVERGATGSVLIRNCLAFKNGYILDGEGNEVHVGLGNGFKLGGSSIACGHRLEDSIAFANGEKGIDSNSSPDAKVNNVISFNNDSNNVALYTMDAGNTDFTVRKVVSVRTEGDVPDKLEPRGTQDRQDMYHESNYYFDGRCSVNADGQQVEASIFADLDIGKAIHGGICRKEDGSICLNGFLERR